MTIQDRPTIRALRGDEAQALLVRMFDWQSVVVKGPFSPRHSPFANWDYDRALVALRRLLPSTLTDDDPTPYRDIVFGVHASEIFGRRSTSSYVAEEVAVG